MKRILSTISLCLLACLTVLAQYKGVSVLDLELRNSENITHVNIYMADKYFHFADRAKPVAQVPVKDGRIHYEVMLDRLAGVRFRCVDADGKEESRRHSIFVVPGQSYSLSLFPDLIANSDGDLFNRGCRKERCLNVVRQKTRWKSPYLPKIKGNVWQEPQQEDNGSTGLDIREVYFGDQETVVRVYHNEGYSNLLDKKDYLIDEAGNHYKLLRPILGGFHYDQDVEVGVYGGYYAFEPLPKDTKRFDLCNYYHGKIRNIHPATKPGKPNFSITVTDAPEIEGTGWILRLRDDLQSLHYTQIADLPVDKNGRLTYEFYLDKPCMMDLLSTSPDGRAGDIHIWIPAVPGCHADVTAKKRGYEWTGTGFYKEVDEASAYADSVRQNRSRQEYIPLLRRYLYNHAQEQGCLFYYYRTDLLPISEVKEILPKDALATPFGQLFTGRDGR